MKSLMVLLPFLQISRSRKGAWIEIMMNINPVTQTSCRSRKGAWIEIAVEAVMERLCWVAPVRERGLK